ncbi:MAG: hypothetical protein WC824_14810, partial [Bacteroidota bacterium]
EEAETFHLRFSKQEYFQITWVPDGYDGWHKVRAKDVERIKSFKKADLSLGCHFECTCVDGEAGAIVTYADGTVEGCPQTESGATRLSQKIIDGAVSLLPISEGKPQ